MIENFKPIKDEERYSIYIDVAGTTESVVFVKSFYDPENSENFTMKVEFYQERYRDPSEFIQLFTKITQSIAGNFLQENEQKDIPRKK